MYVCMYISIYHLITLFVQKAFDFFFTCLTVFQPLSVFFLVKSSICVRIFCNQISIKNFINVLKTIKSVFEIHFILNLFAGETIYEGYPTSETVNT